MHGHAKDKQLQFFTCDFVTPRDISMFLMCLAPVDGKNDKFKYALTLEEQTISPCQWISHHEQIDEQESRAQDNFMRSMPLIP